ncbi:MAG: thiamine pyrophosphate-dependent dehydrogenase E1 component subunit alpha [bacterium]
MATRAKSLTKKRLHEMYRTMLRIRRFEEKTDELFMAGRIKGAVHVSIGQEACSVGVCSALKREDAILTTHRGHGHSIAKGTRLPEMMAELQGKSTGLCRAKGGSMHIADISVGHFGAHSIVGANMPMATGMGLAYQLEGKKRVAVVFFGDGASNQGSFHESMNLCAIWKLPVVFFCENNQYAVSFHVRRSTAVKDISLRSQGYDAPGVTVDGMDVTAVHEATVAAVQRARKGEGPTLIEAKTYRFFGHSRGDPQFGPYRTKEEVDAWRKRDPLILCEKMLKMTKAEKKAHDEATEKELAKAVEFAENSPGPTFESALEDVYA